MGETASTAGPACIQRQPGQRNYIPRRERGWFNSAADVLWSEVINTLQCEGLKMVQPSHQSHPLSLSSSDMNTTGAGCFRSIARRSSINEKPRTQIRRVTTSRHTQSVWTRMDWMSFIDLRFLRRLKLQSTAFQSFDLMIGIFKITQN